MADPTVDEILGEVLMHPHEAGDVSGVLKLDQTTPQTVDNGSPLFNEGITIKAGEKLYLDG